MISQTYNYLKRERRQLLTVAGFFALACLVVSPLRNVPVIDDWTYAWPVEHLLKTGRLAVLDWSANYTIFQTLWGALFSLPFGFSFGALRISTVVLAAFGCAAFYLTLRELDLDRRRGLIGTFALAANPVFFVLSFSFMTDVVFLSLTNAAVLCYVAGLKRARPSLLWLGAPFAVAACLTRQIGVVLPFALLPCVLRKDERLPRWKMAAPFLVSALCVGLTVLWERENFGVTSVMDQKMNAVRDWLTLGAGEYLNDNVNILLQTAFYLVPISLAGISLKKRRPLVAILILAVCLGLLSWWRFGHVPVPVQPGETWGVNDLGDSRGLVSGEPETTGLFSRLALPLGALALLSASALLVNGSASLRRFSFKVSGPALVVVALGVLHLAAINALWLYYDRYYLVLLPCAIFLALKATARAAFSAKVAAAFVGVFALVSLSGTWDALRFNQACLEGYDYLRASGVPASEIDAGYAINGWVLYAHPENLPPGADPTEDVPFVTSDEDMPYKIANVPLPDHEVLKEIKWRGSLWSATDRLYVLHRQEAASEDQP